jgi:hypothetical protein
MTKDGNKTSSPKRRRGGKGAPKQQEEQLNQFTQPVTHTPATYDLITGETINTYSKDVLNNNISYDNLLMQTIRLDVFGEQFDSTDSQSLFCQEQFQSALNIATRRTVSYKINNTWKEHHEYFKKVVQGLEAYYSLDAIIRFTDNPASKNATLTAYRDSIINAEVLDRHRVLGRILETCFLPKKVHDYIFNVYTLRLSGITGNSTIIGYTALDYDTFTLPSQLLTRVNSYINDITGLVTGATANNVATNLSNLITRTDLNWKISIMEMPSVLGYEAEFCNLFMNSHKGYRPGTTLIQKFPTGRRKLSYTEGQMNPLTVISTGDDNEYGIIVPTVATTNALSYIKSTVNATIVRVTQGSSDAQTSMFGTPGYFVVTSGSTITNVQNLLPGGKLTFGTTGENRVSLINNLYYEMLEIQALS